MSSALHPNVHRSSGHSRLLVRILQFLFLAANLSQAQPAVDAQVDLMWKILPRTVVRDNFGSRVAKRYYAVEIMIGNNSGNDLQIAGVGFSMPACKITGVTRGTPESEPTFDCTDSTSLARIPTDSHQIVRGSLEREDQFGRRHVALSAIKTIGLLMTGLLPFFPSSSSNADEVASLVNNPITQGFELIFPRTTLAQLLRLEIQALRDGMIVPHNAQRRVLSFISKKVVGLSESDIDDPRRAMARLGEMVLVGKHVEYLQRVQVISQHDGSVSPPVDTETEPTEISQGATNVEFRLSGLNLEEVDVALARQGGGLAVHETLPGQGGHSLKFKLSAEPDARLGSQTLLLKNSYGSFPLTIAVVRAVP